MEWSALVSESEQTGLTIKELCRRRYPSCRSLCDWRRLATELPDDGLVEIIPIGEPSNCKTRTKGSSRVGAGAACGAPDRGP